MTERPVSLDLRRPSEHTLGDRTGGMTGGTPQHAPDQDSVSRFNAQLRGQPGEPAMAGSAHAAPTSPFDLFAREAAKPPESDSPDRVGVMTTIWDRSLEEGVKRLMVAEDQRSLRMDLDAALFPGVTVEVFEDAGAWVAQFTCSDEQSFDRLARVADEMSGRMADTLKRDALWRVRPDEQAVIQRAPVEAFRFAPGGGLR